MKALSKWFSTTTLPWGAEISIMFTKDFGEIKHHFTISHAGNTPDKLMVNMVPELSANRELKFINHRSAPEGAVGGSTTFTVVNPRKGDVIFIDPAVFELNANFFAAFLVYTGWRWKSMRRPYKEIERWGSYDCFMYTERFNAGPCSLRLYIKTIGGVGVGVTFGESYVDCLQLARRDMFDVLVGRLKLETLFFTTFGRSRALVSEQRLLRESAEREAAHANDEINRLRIAGIFFANRVWSARGISKSAKFADPRRMFEAALCFSRIEEGPEKGTLVEISPEEAAQTIYTIEKSWLRSSAKGSVQTQ